MKNLRVAHFLFSLLLFSTMLVASGSGQSQLQWSIHFQIEVLDDGSAVWLVQQKASLTTEDDVAAFWQYLNITSFDDVSNYIISMVDHARLVTGRSMRVENGSIVVNGNVSLLTNEGIFQYQFDWLGFAERIENSKIRVGDVFSGELDLARDDSLTIAYPNEYSPTYVYPNPDDMQESQGTVTWFGSRNFGAGEPNIILEESNFTWTNAVIANIPLLSVIAAAASFGLLGYFFGMKRAIRSRNLRPNLGPRQTTSSVEDVADDKEKIVKVLVKVGGRMYQSTIAKQCGFSKAKTSELLSSMEKEGAITRKKMGRGKIVTLIKL
jgi:hypothetical protein